MIREITPTEEQEQAYLFQWAALMENQYPELRLLFHIPNGGLRSKSEAVRFKRTGVKPGVPDLFLPVPKAGFHGVFIELKRKSNAKVSEGQKRWLHILGKQGYFCSVCYGAESACETLENYLLGRITT